ncbi:Cytochrome b5-like heme/steroid binding domain [Pseudocohnilembus persalinus]|uniref:Cytochrome b5 domain-containing protein 1 n=1 Tax=Pseudocohnilembus persalinus TaxID=266149 RepID=A0A0V0QMV7_PSEPJ|nr:Cytochrome b5-like heme/steroid binding domain [Pseudocohnilembus persalinus]|eukprot:KRX03683.1 Cytochrome b5-like heme/steroid binding domain [Pseudocohnilembus persalinus]
MQQKGKPSDQQGKSEYLPKPYVKKRYYTPADVRIHNTANDCWVTFFHKVYDLTPLIQDNIESELTRPIIKAAGTDITYWFHSQTKEPRTSVDISTGLQSTYCPLGLYLHVSPTGPSSEFSQSVQTPWWRDEQYCIGNLTQKPRDIKIINMLTEHEDIIQVPSEETINEILERYRAINEHAASYQWKRLGRPLNMEKTLEENQIADEGELYESLDIPLKEQYIPAIHLYFKDDLTVA